MNMPRKMGRLLISAWLLVMGGFVLLGSGEPEVNVGRRPYGHGGMSTQGVGVGGYTAVDTFTIMFVGDNTLTSGHSLAAYDAAVGAADTLIDLTGTGFAFANLDITAPELPYRSATLIRSCTMDGGAGITEASLDDITFLSLLYYPWENRIPTNATILSAEVHGVVQTSTLPASAEDSTYAVLMTNANWNQWHQWTGYSDNEFQSSASFDRQWSHSASYTSPAALDTVGKAWDFPEVGAFYWDIGDEALDIHSYNKASVAAGDEYYFSIKNCVQAAVNGTTNNGIAWMVMDKNAGSNNARVYGFHGATNTLQPWISITYTTQRYTSRFPDGKEVAIVFSTDDGLDDNIDFAAVMNDTLGVPFTIYLRGDKVGEANSLTWAQALALRAAGNEVGSHSVEHEVGDGGNYSGLNHWAASGALDVSTYYSSMAIADTVTSWNALLRDADPWFMYQGILTGGGSVADVLAAYTDPLWAKSFALPFSLNRAESGLALEHFGYSSVRGGFVASRLNGVDREWSWLGGIPTDPLNPANTDTSYAGFNVADPQRPLNLVLHPLTHAASELVNGGPVAMAEDSVRIWFRKAVLFAKGSGRGVVSFYTHSEKGNPEGYTSGMDKEELKWGIDEAIDVGAKVMTVGQCQARLKAMANTIDTPSGWHDDPIYDFAKEDRVWFRPWGANYRPNNNLTYFTDEDHSKRYGIERALASTRNGGEVVLYFTRSSYPNDMANYLNNVDTLNVGGKSYLTADAKVDSAYGKSTLLFVDHGLTHAIIDGLDGDIFTLGLDPSVTNDVHFRYNCFDALGVATDTTAVVGTAFTTTPSWDVNTNVFSFETNTLVVPPRVSNVPPGLTINSSTGEISGTPTMGGEYIFWVKAGCASGCDGVKWIQKGQINIAHVAPTIASITGTPADGDTLTLTGLAFGEKDPVAPFMWDDFEDGVDGEQMFTMPAGTDGNTWQWIDDQTKWDRWYGYATPAHAPYIFSYTDSLSVDGRGMCLEVWNPTDANLNYILKAFDPTGKLYFNADVVQRFPDVSDPVAYPDSASSGNLKMMRWRGGMIGRHGANTVYYRTSCAGGETGGVMGLDYGSPRPDCFVEGAHNGSSALDLDYTSWTSWQNIEWFKLEGAPDVLDGYSVLYVDRRKAHETSVFCDTGQYWLTDSGNDEFYWDVLEVGGQSPTSDAPPYDNGICAYLPSGSMTIWDHVYADNTPARIEIGDSADRDSCTRLEIQLPTSWAYGSAEFILRFGPEFAADDTVWVFIHTDADSVNAEGEWMVLE